MHAYICIYVARTLLKKNMISELGIGIATSIFQLALTAIWKRTLHACFCGSWIKSELLNCCGIAIEHISTFEVAFCCSENRAIGPTETINPLRYLPSFKWIDLHTFRSIH